MTGGGEGEGRKIDWPLVISISALLFGVVQFVREMNDDTQANAIANAEKLIELKKDTFELSRRVDNLECRAGVTCVEGSGR